MVLAGRRTFMNSFARDGRRRHGAPRLAALARRAVARVIPPRRRRARRIFRSLCACCSTLRACAVSSLLAARHLCEALRYSASSALLRIARCARARLGAGYNSCGCIWPQLSALSAGTLPAAMGRRSRCQRRGFEHSDAARRAVDAHEPLGASGGEGGGGDERAAATEAARGCGVVAAEQPHAAFVASQRRARVH